MPQPAAGTIVAHFIAGAGETFTSSPERLDLWSDLSGNGYHATQVTSSNRFYDESLTPTAYNAVDDVVNGRQALGGAGFNNFLNLHASQPIDYRNCAVLFVHRKLNSPLQQVTSSLTIATAFGYAGAPVLQVNGDGKLQWSTSPLPTAEVPACTPTSGANVFGFLGRADGSHFAFGDRIIPGTATPAAGSTTGGLLGRGNAGGSLIPCAGQFYEWVFLSDLTVAGFREWAEWLSGKYNWGNGSFYVPKSSSLLTVGDSTLAGEPIYQTTSIIPERLAYYFPSSHVTTGSVSSMTVATTGGNHVDQQIFRGRFILNGEVATGESVHPQPVRICMIMAGTNDINSAVSAADIKTALTTRTTEAKSYGATHVAICTIMDSTFHDSTEDAVRAQVNTDIKNLASGIDHDIVINLHESANGGDDRLNDATANVGGLFEDGLHPSAAGRDVIVEIIRQNLALYLGAGSITAGNPLIDRRNLMYIPENTTEPMFRVKLPDRTVDVVFNAAGLVVAYRREDQTTFTTVTLAAGTLGTWITSTWIKEADGSDLYQLCLPAAAIVSGLKTFLRLTYAGDVANGTISATEGAGGPTAAAANKIADHVRRRTQANVEASADGDALSLGSLYGLVQQGQESNATATVGSLTVYRTDGTTVLGTKVLSTNATADPVDGIS